MSSSSIIGRPALLALRPHLGGLLLLLRLART
jgi:hypothetical protein